MKLGEGGVSPYYFLNSRGGGMSSSYPLPESALVQLHVHIVLHNVHFLN